MFTDSIAPDRDESFNPNDVVTQLRLTIDNITYNEAGIQEDSYIDFLCQLFGHWAATESKVMFVPANVYANSDAWDQVRNNPAKWFGYESDWFYYAIPLASLIQAIEILETEHTHFGFILLSSNKANAFTAVYSKQDKEIVHRSASGDTQKKGRQANRHRPYPRTAGLPNAYFVSERSATGDTIGGWCPDL